MNPVFLNNFLTKEVNVSFNSKKDKELPGTYPVRAVCCLHMHKTGFVRTGHRLLNPRYLKYLNIYLNMLKPC